jgi:hypothetical protein
VIVLAAVTFRYRRAHRLRTASAWAGLALLGWLPLAAWIARGADVPGFAKSTGWIVAPRPQDVWDLVTTTFGAGGMTPHKDGFVWTSPLGALAVVVLVAGALVYGRASRRRPPDGLPDDLAAASVILLVLTAVVTAAVFAISQVWHLWTLRNMLVVAPALAWGVICLAARASGSAAGSRWTATAAVVLLGAGLVPTALGIAHPYKTDFRDLVGYLAAVQAQDPAGRVVVLGNDQPAQWSVAGDTRAANEARPALARALAVYPGTAPGDLPAGVSPSVVVVYHGVADPRPDAWVSAVLRRLDDPSCRSVPVYGFGVVRCA